MKCLRNYLFQKVKIGSHIESGNERIFCFTDILYFNYFYTLTIAVSQNYISKLFFCDLYDSSVFNSFNLLLRSL